MYTDHFFGNAVDWESVREKVQLKDLRITRDGSLRKVQLEEKRIVHGGGS